MLFQKVRPKKSHDGNEQGSYQKNIQAKLPAGVELTVSNPPIAFDGKTYYRILACEFDVKFLGYYVNEKDTTLVESEKDNGGNTDVISEGG